jgi:hypothetical protein
MTSVMGRWPRARLRTRTSAVPFFTVIASGSIRGERRPAASERRSRGQSSPPARRLAAAVKISLQTLSQSPRAAARSSRRTTSPASRAGPLAAFGFSSSPSEQPAAPRSPSTHATVAAFTAMRIMLGMEGSAPDSVGTQSSWLRCYRCWSQNLEVQLHYEGILKVDPGSGEAVDPVEEVQEAVVQCLDCLHDQPHLSLTFYEEDGRRVSRIEAVEDRWERMVTGTPWVASCTVTVDADQVESCSGPEAADSLAFAAFGDHGTREFFTHVRFHKHEEDRIVIHMLVELYARSPEEATEVMESAARGSLAITSLAEESRPPASSGADEQH